MTKFTAKTRARGATKRLIRIAYFSALTAAGAFIRIPIGEVAFSMQTFFVIMAGLVLSAADSFFAQLAYVLIGLIGVPIFTQGGGFSYVFRPSFGYLVGFCVGAPVAAITLKVMGGDRSLKVWAAALAGLVPMYAIGAAYQVMILTLVNDVSLSAALLSLVSIALFLAFDVCTLLLVALVYPRLLRAIGARPSANLAQIGPSDSPEPPVSPEVSEQSEPSDASSENPAQNK